MDAFFLSPDLKPDPAEVLRYLGYPAGARVHTRIEESVRRVIEDAQGLAGPRGTYAVHPVIACTPRSITLAGGTVFHGAIGEFLGGARRVAVFVATAGPEVVRIAEDASRSRDTLSALVWNAFGAHLADAMMARLVVDLGSRLTPEEALTLPYSPGYCGLALAEQRTLFRLLDAGAVGVELLPSLIMKPIKSISGLIGLGPRETIPGLHGPCDRCSMLDCRMRR